jgi:hypothetical protein
MALVILGLLYLSISILRAMIHFFWMERGRIIKASVILLNKGTNFFHDSLTKAHRES